MEFVFPNAQFPAGVFNVDFGRSSDNVIDGEAEHT
jgi:hypothetical protein